MTTRAVAGRARNVLTPPKSGRAAGDRRDSATRSRPRPRGPRRNAETRRAAKTPSGRRAERDGTTTTIIMMVLFNVVAERAIRTRCTLLGKRLRRPGGGEPTTIAKLTRARKRRPRLWRRLERRGGG